MSKPSKSSKKTGQMLNRKEKESDIRMSNIQAAKTIADIMRTSLGPKGMDKMMQTGKGHTLITNDGATILRQMNITHPTANMIIEVARVQEETCYDGTTSSVIITGELMRQAESLLAKKIHPTMIVKGFKLAGNKADELLDDIALSGGEHLLTVAKTAMTGKSAETDKDVLAQICLDVASSAKLGDISIIKRPGGKVSESIAIAGLLLDKSKVHHNMPDVVEDPKIALIEVDITLPEFAKELQVQVHNNDAVEEFITKRKAQLQNIAQGLIDSGATVVLCLRDIDRLVVEYLTKHGVYAARRVAKSDIEAVSKATGARIVAAIDDLTSKDLGSAKLLEEVLVNDEPLVKLTGTPNSEAVSVLLRAPTKHTVAEIGRAFNRNKGSLGQK